MYNTTINGELNNPKIINRINKYMPFSDVPCEAKSQINKAGKILIKEPTEYNRDYFDAIYLANRWRACHAYPINTFQSTLRTKVKSSVFGHNPIVAQRLKRMPTIIDKLKRYSPNMQLTTMQDIGGVRAILDTIDNVYRLAREYRDSKQLLHKLVHEYDYIQNPRDEDGYRSLHLIYKYKNKHAPQYNDLRVELQIRTKLQHVWATAVETMGTFLGQALKSRQGDKKWIDFFAVVSSAFAHQEKTSLVPHCAKLSRKETFLEVAQAEKDLGALEIMDGFALAANDIAKQRVPGKSWSYHLIVLDSLSKVVNITAFDRESLAEALTEYSKVEAQAAQGMKIEPVLVSAGRIDTLRQAYPNFFLDITEFIGNVKQIVASTIDNG